MNEEDVIRFLDEKLKKGRMIVKELSKGVQKKKRKDEWMDGVSEDYFNYLV